MKMGTDAGNWKATSLTGSKRLRYLLAGGYGYLLESNSGLLIPFPSKPLR